ncbi:unnamed protein product, partial [Rotaria sp. Silwood2]
LSNYFRHVTHQYPCTIIQENLESLNESISDNVAATNGYVNGSVDAITDSTSSSITSSLQTPNVTQKRRKKLNPSVIKKKKLK